MRATIVVLAALCTAGTSLQATGGSVVQSGPVSLVLPVRGVPISAEQIEERTRTASDRKSVSEILTAKIFRDRAGRMRIEWRIESDGRDSVRVAYLLDPVAASAYMLFLDASIAVKMSGPESGDFRVGFPSVGQMQPDGKWQTKTEALGTRVIQGVEAEGARRSSTSEGEPPLTVLREVWLCRDLHLTILEEASGPGWRHNARLENLDRREPDPDLFVIPPGYTVQSDN